MEEKLQNKLCTGGGMVKGRNKRSTLKCTEINVSKEETIIKEIYCFNKKLCIKKDSDRK
jgi:hypothetical protein